MKKAKALLFAILLCAPLTASAQDVEINAENFPDENFRNYLLEQGYGKEGVLKESTLQSMGGLVISNKNIRDLKGIEFFVSLTHLDCSDNQLTTLDLSDNTKLVTLFCNDNALTTLNIAECKALTTIRCYHNQIKGESMEALISSLPQNPTNSQYAIYIYDNVTSGEGNVCTTAQVSAAKAKGWLPVSYNGTGWAAYEGSSTYEVVIDEANFPDANFRSWLLEQDYGQDGILTEVEISKITMLFVGSLGISNLRGIEHFTALTFLDCVDNKLTTLDVSKNTALTRLNCGLNLLTSLDVSKNTALTSLVCYDNQLTVLDVSECTILENLTCFHNQIKGEAMDFLISSLYQNTSDHPHPLYIYDTNSGSEGNICTKSQVIAAKAKGWQAYCSTSFDPTTGWQWGEYEGSDDTDTSLTQPELGVENSVTPIHTLFGQKVKTASKGIYIIGSKKMVVK